MSSPSTPASVHAFVTGAASGIGAALVEALRCKGAIVWAADLDPLIGDTWGGRDDVVPLQLDVGDPAEVEDAIQSIADTTGHLDLVINNAGILTAGPFESISHDQWRRAVDVNLWGVVNGTRSAYEVMQQQGYGHIVNVASSAGVLPVAGSVPYATTKHAVVGLSSSLRAEAQRSRSGVKVSVVLPGLVETAVYANAETSGGYDYAAAMEKVPFRKITPRQAADEILRGVAANRAEITFPAYNRLLIALYRRVPSRMLSVVNQGHRPPR